MTSFDAHREPGTTASSAGKADLDPELLALPAPPTRERSVTLLLLILTAIASALMAFALRHDAAYAWSATPSIDLGEIQAPTVDSSTADRFVTGSVRLGAAEAIRYERPLVEGSFRLMPILTAEPDATKDEIWVELHLPSGIDRERWVPPSRITGRLLRFSHAGLRHRGLAAAVHAATGRPFSERAWLLVENEAPESGWTALVLMALFAGFACWSTFTAAKILRRISPALPEGPLPPQGTRAPSREC
jgi:hypothetical protein